MLSDDFLRWQGHRHSDMYEKKLKGLSIIVKNILFFLYVHYHKYFLQVKIGPWTNYMVEWLGILRHIV